MKPSIIVFASCISDALVYFLHMSDGLHKRYKVVPVVYNSEHRAKAYLNWVSQILKHDDVLICHPMDVIWPMTTIAEDYEAFFSTLHASVRRITIPLPHCHMLWPFSCDEPRNRQPDRPPNRFGYPPIWHYGDAFVHQMLKEGVDQEEIHRRYVEADLSQIVDLQQLRRTTRDLLETQDRECDVQVAGFVEDVLIRSPLFHTMNHASNRLMLNITNKVLALLGCDPVPETVLERSQEWVPLEVPIHPSVARYYDLSYGQSLSDRYSVDKRQRLTFSEYMRDYISFEFGGLDYSFIKKSSQAYQKFAGISPDADVF